MGLKDYIDKLSVYMLECVCVCVGLEDHPDNLI